MAAGWHVITQVQEEQLMPGSFTFTPGVRVTFQLEPEGTIGNIWFSAREYTPENVGGRIQSTVDTMRAIANL